MQKEIWKDVPGYEGSYQVSTLGRVKSLERLIPFKSTHILIEGKILKPYFIRDYYQVDLHKDKKNRRFSVHQVVAMAFLNHTPCGYKIVVNHKDFNPKNNRLENLELVTQRENSNLKHKPSSSKYTGVCWNKANNNWLASIVINRRSTHIGCYKNEYIAHIAYELRLAKLKYINDV